ncbi:MULTISPECIES: hypothetical protein [unclassified Vibrio]|uniref:hypothetical protein n=1 Tax=unclassified Vibrio TaxID=2614977 RepID=UPI00355469C3
MDKAVREERDDAYEEIKAQLQQWPMDKLTMLLDELNVAVTPQSVPTLVPLSHEEIEMLTKH